MGTNVKINIFVTLPEASENVNKKYISTIFLNMTRSTNIFMYSFSKIITVRGYAFIIKTSTIFITIHGFHFSYISRIKSLSRFRNEGWSASHLIS